MGCRGLRQAQQVHAWAAKAQQGAKARMVRLSADSRSWRGDRRQWIHSTAVEWKQKQPPTNYYAVLGVDHGSSMSEIKKAYFDLAQHAHPDRAEGDKVLAATQFAMYADGYKVLMDGEARGRHDALLANDAPAGGRHSSETAAEAELRRLIETNQIDEAVSKWASIGADLPLLLHIIDVCHKINRMPSDLKLLLDHLHSSEERRETAETKANSAAGSVTRFVERKTKAYNHLIRLCDGCGTKADVFLVLDEMERNKIQIDMGTYYALEEVFQWKA